MSEQPAYFVANLIIHDADEYRKYEKGFFPIFKQYGGEFITYDDSPITLEGAHPRQGRMIIAKFPSEKAALDWYDSEEYQAICEHRRKGGELQFLTIVKSLPPRG